MTLPRSIFESAEKAFAEKRSTIPHHKECPMCSDLHHGFKLGVEWLIEHLCALSEKEFDEKYHEHAALEWAQSPKKYKPQCLIRDWTAGARHQHALDMAAIARANENAFHLELKHNRIAEELAQAKAENIACMQTITQMGDEIERLKKELGHE